MNLDIYAKFNMLSLDRQAHSLMCMHLTSQLITSHNILKLNRSVILFTAQFHDIGYCKLISKYDFHPIDGALYLERIGLPRDIYVAIANHSNAIQLKPKDNSNIYEDKYKVRIEREQLVLDVIDLVDAHVNSKGEIVSLQMRAEDILNRYGENSLQYTVFINNINRLKDLENQFNWSMLMESCSKKIG